MKALCTIGLTALALTFSAVVFGADKDQGKQGKRDEVQTVTFDELRLACTDPHRFHNQVAPSNIEITCADSHYKWVEDAEGDFQMGCPRMITTSILSDKYQVNTKSDQVQSADQKGSCPRYKRVLETVSVSRSLSCEDLLGYKGTAADYCVDVVNNLKGANSQAAQVQETGEVVNLCDNVKVTKQGQGK